MQAAVGQDEALAAGAFAAHMLDRPELTALAGATPSWPGDLDTLGQEQHQVFTLPGSAVDTPVAVNLTDAAAHYGQDYQPEQVGLPEWEGFDPANDPAFPVSETVSAPAPEPELPVPGAALAVRYGPDPAYVGPTTGDFYVATDGDDANAGTSVAAPFATVQAAIDAADAAGGARTILLRGGTYRQQASFKDKTADISLLAYGGEAPVMTASEPLSGWTACTSGDQTEVGAQFASIYKATVTLADLQHGGRHLLNLYENGVRCDIAQDRAVDTNPHAWGDDATYHTGTRSERAHV